MPELWSSILVEIRNGKFYPDKRTVEMWIERSGSSALSFFIEERDSLFRSSHEGFGQVLRSLLYSDTDSEHPGESPVASMLDLFIPHHFRWQKVRLRYNDVWPEAVGFASFPMDTTYPLLEEVYLDKRCWCKQDVNRIKSMMVSAPRLHSVSWLCHESYWTLVFPWEHFSLCPVTTINKSLRIIATCPHLKFLQLTLVLPMFLGDNDDDPFVHNTLQHLYLSAAGNLSALFNKVTPPALKDLSLSEMDGALPLK